MFDSGSRYYNLNTATTEVTDSDGSTRQVRYVQRRIIPPAEDTITIVEHTVTEGDRLDNITARYLGDPTEFWLICDTNNVLRPNELTETIGRMIKIALPRL